jgi:hypothetical protein
MYSGPSLPQFHLPLLPRIRLLISHCRDGAAMHRIKTEANIFKTLKLNLVGSYRYDRQQRPFVIQKTKVLSQCRWITGTNKAKLSLFRLTSIESLMY